jgi:hypothetical protein
MIRIKKILTQVMTDSEKIEKIKAVIQDKKKKPVVVKVINVVTEVDFL